MNAPNNPAEAAFHAKVAEFERAAPSSGPDENALAIISETAKHQIDGKPAMLTNMKFAKAIETMRSDVFAGKPFDQNAAKAMAYEALGLALPAAPAEAAPAPPGEGSPIDRLAERLSAGEFLQPSELPPEALGGYRVDLPEGYGLDSYHIEMLQVARDAGISQSEVDKYIRQLTK